MPCRKAGHNQQTSAEKPSRPAPAVQPAACVTLLTCNHAACAARHLSRSCSGKILNRLPMRAPQHPLLHGRAAFWQAAGQQKGVPAVTCVWLAGLRLWTL